MYGKLKAADGSFGADESHVLYDYICHGVGDPKGDWKEFMHFFLLLIKQNYLFHYSSWILRILMTKLTPAMLAVLSPIAVPRKFTEIPQKFFENQKRRLQQAQTGLQRAIEEEIAPKIVSAATSSLLPEFSETVASSSVRDLLAFVKQQQEMNFWFRAAVQLITVQFTDPKCFEELKASGQVDIFYEQFFVRLAASRKTPDRSISARCDSPDRVSAAII